MKYESIIRKIISENLNATESIETFDINENLQNIGMDSIAFVKIIVELEGNFDIEFPSEKLIIAEAGTINKLCEIMEYCKKE